MSLLLLFPLHPPSRKTLVPDLEDWEPGNLHSHIPCSLGHGEEIGVEFTGSTRTPNLLSRLVMGMPEEGCLGFPKVVLRRPKIGQLRQILFGICSRFIEQPATLRDVLQGPPSNPWFLAWVLKAPRKQQAHRSFLSFTPKSSRDATRASFGQPGLGPSTCEGHVQVQDNLEKRVGF